MARSNKIVVPDAKQSLDSFKMEVANSLNVNLKQGYNGDISAKEAGSVGGNMVKRMITYAENNMNGNMMKYIIHREKFLSKRARLLRPFFACIECGPVDCRKKW